MLIIIAGSVCLLVLISHSRTPILLSTFVSMSAYEGNSVIILLINVCLNAHPIPNITGTLQLASVCSTAARVSGHRHQVADAYPNAV